MANKKSPEEATQLQGKPLQRSKPKVASSEPKLVVIPQLRILKAEIRIVGDSPLICHAWSKKAKEQILAKQMKQATEGRAAKNPQQDYEESLYRLSDGSCGFPTVAFKASAVDACSFIPNLTKVEARGAFHMIGEMVQLEGEPHMREDMVRIAMGTADIRYRAEFSTWACTLPIRYNAGTLSIEQIVNLFNVAGFSVGIGDWRPQKDGHYGMFHVE